MAKKKSSRVPGTEPDAAVGLPAADTAQLLAMFQQLDAFASAGEPPPPRRLRPRRRTPALFRVRVDLDGAKPPIWRRLLLASDLRLDEVHDALQIAFEWYGGHLHEFHETGDFRTAERFLCDYLVEDGDAGRPETEVRLDQVLGGPGDRLVYWYDFGDDWNHTIRLEEVLPRRDDTGRARLIAGRRAAPPDDCGGVYGYEMLLEAIADPTHPEHAELSEWFEQAVGDLDLFDPAVVDLEELDEGLRDVFG